MIQTLPDGSNTPRVFADCEVCGHAITPRNPDHGFGRVMIADCTDCKACIARWEA